MKRTKNAARLLTLLLVLCMVFLPLVACKTRTATPANQNQQQNSGSQEQDPPIVAKNCTVVITTEPEETVYIVDLNQVGKINNGLLTIFDYLNVTYEESGGLLTKVLTLEQGENYDPFISLYTSVEKDFAIGYGDEKTYNGTKLFTSGEGAKTMTIQENAVYYITLARYLF